MRINEFATDEALEEEGVWLPFGDAELHIARMSNSRFQKMYRQKSRPYGRRLNSDTKLQEQLLIECMAHTVLLGWKNITDDSDKVIKYTPEVGIEYLTKYREFRNIVAEMSGDYANFVQEELEEDVKN